MGKSKSVESPKGGNFEKVWWIVLQQCNQVVIEGPLTGSSL